MKYRQAKKLLKKRRRAYKTEAKTPATDGKRLDVSVTIRTVYPAWYAYAAVEKAASRKFKRNFPRFIEASLSKPDGIATACMRAIKKYVPPIMGSYE